MRQRIFGTWMVAILFGLFGGCGGQGICIDGLSNFTLNRVAYDGENQSLWVAGSQTVFGCYADTAESEAVLSFALDTAGNLSSPEFSRPRKIEEVAGSAPGRHLFHGAFSSQCTSCRMEIPFAENRFRLRFDSAAADFADPMTMTLFDGEAEIARFAIRMGEVAKIVP